MSRANKSKIYQSEYSASFQWTPMNKDIPDEYEEWLSRSVLQDHQRSPRSPKSKEKKLHKYRHKIKQALLEQLITLEEHIYTDDASVDDFSTHSPRRSRKKKAIGHKEHPSVSESTSPLQKCNKRQKNISCKENMKVNGNIMKDELRRSRSLALEFKQKNESTQIWWLNEQQNSSSDERLSAQVDVDKCSSPRKNSYKISDTPYIPVSDANHKLAVRRSSFFSNKVSTEPSLSTFSRSSLSGQIAQATGYQSTTDELSSFNHDADTKSVDKVISTKCPSEIRGNTTVKNRPEEIPVLDLSHTNSDTVKFETVSSPVVFYSPYQTEDFIKDSTSSESFPPPPVSPDTYRLDK